MKKHFLKLSSAIVLGALLFEGCSMLPYRDDFQCQKGKNSGVCGSVSEVYDLSSDMDDLRLRTLDGGKAKAKQEEVKKIEEEKQRQKELFTKQKLQEMVEATEIRNIQNEHPTIFRFYLDEDKRVPTSAPLVWNNDYSVSSSSIGADDSRKDKKSKPQKTTQTKLKTNNAKAEQNSKKDAKALQQNGNLKGRFGSLNAQNNQAENNQSVNALFEVIGDTNASKAVSLKDENTSPAVNEASNKKSEFSNNNELCSPSGGAKKEINAKVKVCVFAANIRENPSCKAKVLRIANKDEVLFALYEQDGWVKLNDGTYIHKSIITQD